MTWQIGSRCLAHVVGEGDLNGRLVKDSPPELIPGNFDGDPIVMPCWVFQADDGRRFEVEEASLKPLEPGE